MYGGLIHSSLPVGTAPKEGEWGGHKCVDYGTALNDLSTSDLVVISGPIKEAKLTEMARNSRAS